MVSPSAHNRSLVGSIPTSSTKDEIPFELQKEIIQQLLQEYVLPQLPEDRKKLIYRIKELTKQMEKRQIS